jgi:hypothetical protein
MSRYSYRSLAVLLLLGAAAPSLAVPLAADFGYTVDEHGGYGLDADFSLSPGEHWTLSASAGHSEGAPENGDISGTLLGVAGAFHGERAGVSLSYDLFDDRSNYQAGTLGVRAWLAAGNLEFALLGRRRDLSAGLTLRLPLRVASREVDFSANGVGLSVSYGNENLNAYLTALEYDYDREFDDFVGLLDSPQLEDRPRLEALVTSFISQAQGIIDRQAGAGIEFGFGRHSVAVDVSFVHDAVLDADGSSFAVTWRHARSAHLDLGLTVGLVDSELFGDIAFVGGSIGLAN